MTKKPYIELLAPAGGPEQFRAALAAGANAIYCGVGNDFNARRGADNFDYDSFEACVREAHLAGARVYVTLNVLVRDDELDRALALVRSCAVRGADAFIIQDWGLFALIHKTWPEIELHVSTQANIHDAEGVRWAAAQGAKRVTLSRELSLAEIADINKVACELDVDLEVFGHGALCFCYSGLCLMSSMMGGRSANRGLCAQPCRLLYELVDSEGARLNALGRTRPLCPKDACTAADIDAMLAAGVGALKIEGRMKAPDYVYNVVSAYRAQIDNVYAAAAVAPRGTGHSGPEALGETNNLGPNAKQGPAQADPAALLGTTPVSAEISHQLKRAFNRDFTDAYLRGTSGDELMSYERSNNRGELAGEVISCKGNQEQRRDGKGNLHKDPRQNKHKATCVARIKLTEPVGAGDLLELRSPDNYDDFLTATVPADTKAGGTIEVKLSRPMPAGSAVRVIRSKVAHTITAQALSREVARQRKVAVRVVAHVGQPFAVELTCVDGHVDALSEYGGTWPSAKAEGFVVEPARTKAVTQEDLIEHVGRMGTSTFEPVSFEVELDEGAGMGFSAVHKVRAAACEALEQAILAPWRERKLAAAPKGTQGGQVALVPEPRGTGHSGPESTKADINSEPTGTGPDAPEICVFAPTPEMAQAAIDAGANRIYATEDVLEQAKLSGKTWPCEPTVIRDEVQREGDTQHPSLEASALVSTVPDLSLAKKKGLPFEVNSTIPVHNAQTLALMQNQGAQTIWLSPELSLAEIEALAAAAQVPLGIMAYGRVRVMTSEHCVLQAANRCIHDCVHCKLRAQAQASNVYLKNKGGKLLPVQTDIHGRSRIFSAEVIDYIPEAQRLKAAGITKFAIDATFLAPQQVTAQIARLQKALAGSTTSKREPEATAGHLFDPVA